MENSSNDVSKEQLLEEISSLRDRLEADKAQLEFQERQIEHYRRVYRMLEVLVKDYLRSDTITKEQFKNYYVNNNQKNRMETELFYEKDKY